MFNVDKLWGIGVLRQEKATGIDYISQDGDADALELLVVGVPRLDDAAFGLDAVGGFEGLEPVEAALAVPALALGPALVADVLVVSGEAAEEEEAEGKREQKRVSHGCVCVLLLLRFEVKRRVGRVGIL